MPGNVAGTDRRRKLPIENKSKSHYPFRLGCAEFFEAKAQESGALPYQTQINQALRRVMENEADNTNTLKSALLNDTDFIRAVAEEAKKLEIT